MHQNIRHTFVDNKPLTHPPMLPTKGTAYTGRRFTSYHVPVRLLNPTGVHSMSLRLHFLPSTDHILNPLIRVIPEK